MKKNKAGWRIAATAGLLLTALAALGAEAVYRNVVIPKGYRWVFDWIETALLALGAAAFAGALILNLAKKRRTKMICMGAAALLAVLVTALTAAMNPVQVSVSPQKERIAVVDTNAAVGEKRLCRVSHTFFRYPKEILPFAADSDLKYDWLEEDVCAVTGRDAGGNIRQYLATYGSRGSTVFYMDPYVPMCGNWQGYDAHGQEWRVTVSSGIGVVNGTEEWFFGESECERYGTIGMTLGEGSSVQFSLIMNRDCHEEDGTLLDGGTLTLCRVSMEEEEKIVLEKADEETAAGWPDYGAAAAALEEQREMEARSEKAAQETGESRCLPLLKSDGTYTEYDDENYEKEVVLKEERIRYRMIVLDAAAGSRWYGLIKSSDGGKSWEVVSDDPFDGELGQGIDFTFLDEDFGFATLAHNVGNTAQLYVTEDGGQHYEPVEIDHKTETDSSGATRIPYDYPRMPYEKDGKIYVLCGQGADGDYNGGDQSETARYRSEDNGHTFVFDGMEPTK